MKLNSHSLHLQWLFWIAVIFPILSCVYFGSIIWYEYPVEVSKHGYNSFLEISKLPLYLLAGSPILGAFVASAHRSYQTDIQIKTANNQLIEARNKNKVDIYFAKRKFINEQLESIFTIDEEKISKLTYLYFESHNVKKNFEDKLNLIFFQKLNGFISDLKVRICKLHEGIESIEYDSVIHNRISHGLIPVDTRLLRVKKHLCLNVKDDKKLFNLFESFLMSHEEFKLRKTMIYNNEITFSESELAGQSPTDIADSEYEIDNHNAFEKFFYALIDALYNILDICKEVSLVLASNIEIETLLPSLNECRSEIHNLYSKYPFS